MNSLDNITKFASLSEEIEKYGYTAVRFYMLELARALLPNERIKVCWRYPLPQRKAVEIIYSDERGKARTAGLMKCGSGWVCPACMGAIAERRRDELQRAIERSEWMTVMLTYTVAHGQQDRLKSTIDGMTKAYRAQRSGRHWQDIKKHYRMQGSIRTMEVTYGQHGWHPHFHELLFLDKSVMDGDNAGSLDELEQALKGDVGGRWYEMLAKDGMHTNIEKAFDVTVGNKYAADYVAKFGRLPSNGDIGTPAYEMTHSNTKTARRGGITPLGLLWASQESDDAKRLFLEYHAATKGRSAVHWSRGLKAALDIEVLRDEIAAEGVETDTDRILAEVELPLWQWLSKRGMIGFVMTVANGGDAQGLKDAIGRMRNKMLKMLDEQPDVQWDLGH